MGRNIKGHEVTQLKNIWYPYIEQRVDLFLVQEY